MKVTVKQVLNVEQRTSKSSGKPYFLTSFMDGDQNFYKDVYGKLSEGQEVDLEQKDGKWEIVRQNGFGGFSRGGGKSADEIESIQRQVALKEARQAIRDFHELMGTLDGEGKTISLNTYLSEISKTSTAFRRHLSNETTPKTQSQDFDRALSTLGGEEAEALPEPF